MGRYDPTIDPRRRVVLGSHVYVATEPGSNEWLLGIVIATKLSESVSAHEGFGVAVLAPGEERFDVALLYADIGSSWRWPDLVPSAQ